jgi:glycine/D-amino acid oxidase-like deaminating enzyme
VVVIEREHVGWGASSRNGGQVLTGLKLEAAELIARLGPSRARQLFETSLEALASLERLIADESIECEYERAGHVHAASKPSHFAQLRNEQKLLASVFGHRVELVPASDQQAEIGTVAYHGLLVDERSGTLNPAKYVQGLGAAACRSGVVVVEGSTVVRLAPAGSRWTVTTDRGTFDARDVLLATNGYGSPAARWLQRRFVPIGSYIIATESLSTEEAARLLPRRRSAFDSRNFLHYFRLTRDNRLLFGGRASFTPPTANTTRRCAEILRRDMTAVFPQLTDTRVDYAWSGNVAFTRDQLPHAGRLHGVYYAGAYFGHGIAMATYLGGLMGRRISGEQVEHPLIDDGPPPIPLYYGTPWFLPFAGAYYRLRDWLS